jgi:hypothetical protein
MKHYRINKLDKRDGAVIKRKDVLANDDSQAIEAAAEDEDCPICDVWHAGEQIGAIE